MAGAVAGMLVAANPEHPGTRFPVPHMICAAAGCAGGGGLAGRGLAARAFGAVGPAADGIGWCCRGAAGLGGLVRVELITGGGLAGLAERGFGAALALWPLAVVASCRHAGRKNPALNLDRSGMRPAGALHRPSRRARNSHSALSHQGSSPPVQPNRIA